MEWIVKIAEGAWMNLVEMAPYLLLGFLVAGILSVLVRREMVERQLGGSGWWPIVKASLLGVPLPLCSCGVIPVAASLRRHGASRGATASFLLSTPQTGVDSILVTYSMLGPVIAIFRPVAAFVSGVVGGWLVERTRPAIVNGVEAAPPVCEEDCCKPGAGGSRLARIFKYGFITLPRDLAKPLIVGLLVAGLIGALVPDDFFVEVLGTGFLSMVVMMGVGIPLYVCATASVPIAVMMIAKGISPGAALVFLMTGPATNAAAIAMVVTMFGRRGAGMYLLAVGGTALLSGWLLDLLVIKVPSVMAHIHHEGGSGPVGVVSAIILIVVLVVALWPQRRHDHHAGCDCEPDDDCRDQPQAL